MLYASNKDLPSEFREDFGLSLCKLWFVTQYGEELNEKTLSNLEDLSSALEIKEISSYKIPFPKGEILEIEGIFHVGDGFGNVRYAPLRDWSIIEGYQNGDYRIQHRFSVEKRV